jgi:hypothetical protein
VDVRLSGHEFDGQQVALARVWAIHRYCVDFFR